MFASQKRKAQNRAAQRAFRERKEKHLKDLETKVQELEQASEAANHENGLLRAKVDKMTVELTEYKKRLSLASNGPPAMRPARGGPPFGQAFVNNINDVNFQFEFPKFGSLPGPPPAGGNGTTNSKSSSASPAAPAGAQREKNGQNDNNSWEKSRDDLSPTSSGGGHSQFNQPRSSSGNLDSLPNYSVGFYNSNLVNSNNSRHNSNGNSNSTTDSNLSQGGQTSTNSPSSSSNSNMGCASSSCGTSPEPYTQSPAGSKPLDTLTTIGEEQSTLSSTSNQGNFQIPSPPPFTRVRVHPFRIYSLNKLVRFW